MNKGGKKNKENVCEKAIETEVKGSLHQTDRPILGQLRSPQKRQESSLCPREEQKARILREKKEGKLNEHIHSKYVFITRLLALNI